jgi:glycolate oxidase
VTREYVLELEVVTGSAEVVRIGHRTAKGVAGYDLVGLLVGSEGALGIVTEITVRLRSLPNAPITVAGFFPSLVAAGSAVRAVGTAGIIPAALELMDRYCLEAVDAWKRMGLAAGGEVLLLARIDDAEPTGGALADRIAECFRDNGASWAERSTRRLEVSGGGGAGSGAGSQRICSSRFLSSFCCALVRRSRRVLNASDRSARPSLAA